MSLKQKYGEATHTIPGNLYAGACAGCSRMAAWHSRWGREPIALLEKTLSPRQAVRIARRGVLEE